MADKFHIYRTEWDDDVEFTATNGDEFAIDFHPNGVYFRFDCGYGERGQVFFTNEQFEQIKPFFAKFANRKEV